MCWQGTITQHFLFDTEWVSSLWWSIISLFDIKNLVNQQITITCTIVEVSYNSNNKYNINLIILI